MPRNMTDSEKRTYKINIKNPVYAKVLTDNAEGTTYDKVYSLGEAMTADVTASIATGSLYGDGAMQDSSARLTGLTLALDVTKIPIEAKADIFNLKVTDGVVQEAGGVDPSYIAVGYNVEQTGGEQEYIWLLKGMPKPINSNVKQSEANIEYSTDKMEITFVTRKSDKMLRFYAETANTEFTAKQAEDWFKTGPAKPVSKT